MPKNLVQHKRTKKIDVRYHLLRGNIEKRAICMNFYKTEDQVDDIFTKALHKEKFMKNRIRLGLIKMN